MVVCVNREGWMLIGSALWQACPGSWQIALALLFPTLAALKTVFPCSVRHESTMCATYTLKTLWKDNEVSIWCQSKANWKFYWEYIFIKKNIYIYIPHQRRVAFKKRNRDSKKKGPLQRGLKRLTFCLMVPTATALQKLTPLAVTPGTWKR